MELRRVAMTENEACKRIKYRMHTAGQVSGECGMKDLEMAIKALEEVQQYHQIGTMEECREAVEKQTAKKVTSFDYHNGTVNYGCPICKRKIISKIDGEWCGGTFNEYCDRCGQKLDWSDGDGN